MQTFEFSHPWILLSLLILPFGLWIATKLGSPCHSIHYSALHLFQSKTHNPHFIPFIFRFLGLTCLILALARPRGVIEHKHSQSNGIDMILALDLSSSMQIPDFAVNQMQRVSRIHAAKAVLSEFIQQREQDRIGLVAFARYPYLVSPLTLNHAWLLKNLDRLNAGLIEDGTAIGSAITMSINRLKDLKAKTRLIILLTDGVNNYGNVAPLLAADIAKSFQTKIYTIMVGNDQVFPVDEQTLIQMAEKTGGLFYRAYDVHSLQAIYKEINQLEKSKVVLEGFKTYNEIFPWFLLLALIFLSTEYFLKLTRYKVLS